MSPFMMRTAVTVVLLAALAGCSRSQQAEKFFEKGKALEEIGNLTGAMALYDKAIKADAHYAQAYQHRGQIYARRGQYDRALAELGRTIDLSQDAAEAYYERGALYVLRNRSEEAIADFTRALEEKPDYFDAYLSRAGAYYVRGVLDKGMEDCETAMRLRPDAGKPYLARAIIYLARQEFPAALEDLEKAARLDTSLTKDIQAVTSRIQEIQKRRQEAPQETAASGITPDEEKYLAGIQEQPENYKNYLGLAGIYAAKGEGPKAAEYAQKALDAAPDEAVAEGGYVLLSLGYYYSGQLQKSYETVQLAAAAHPEDARAQGLKTMLEAARDQQYGGNLPEQATFGGYATAAEAGRAMLQQGYGVVSKEEGQLDEIRFPAKTITLAPPPGWKKAANVTFGPAQRAFLVYQKYGSKVLPTIGITRDNAEGAADVMAFSKKVSEAMASRFDLLELKPVDIAGLTGARLRMIDRPGRKVVTVWYQFLDEDAVISLQYMNTQERDAQDYPEFEALVQSLRLVATPAQE